MSANIEAIITAGLRPELFSQTRALFGSRALLITALMALVIVGFGLRVTGLSAEGLSEDELNKLYAVSDYRAHGITSVNGEHPMLMKSLQTASIVLTERWNSSAFVSNASDLYLQPEAALRLPGVIFGAFTAILIYLLTAELFGTEVALIAAALWTFDPNAIGFSRIAKEDTFLVFFFLLANVFWLRAQRVAESEPQKNPSRYYWATAAAFGAMVASKYVPHLIAISISYYWVFQNLPETRWRLGKRKMLVFFGIMGAVFLLLSPTVLLPDTWRQMGLFAGQKLVGHDGYEFMGQIYSHRWSDWLRGTPWYFYLVFTWVKLPLLTLAGLLVGFPLLFRRKLGDGRYLVLFWLFFFFFSFSFPGGKFTRYYTVVLPAVLITAALGVQFIGHWLALRLKLLRATTGIAANARASVALLVVVGSIIASMTVTPYFRLYLNRLGGGQTWAGYYFPHDEFYDTSMRDAVTEIARRSKAGAHIASESPALASYYAGRINRPDLVCVSLSDSAALKQLGEDDFVIAARGRRYFSNDALLTSLHQSTSPEIHVMAGNVPSADVYRLDRTTIGIVRENADRMPVFVSTTNIVPAPVN